MSNYQTIKVYSGNWKVTGIHPDNSRWWTGDFQLQHDGRKWRCALTNANNPRTSPVCYRLTGQIKKVMTNQRLILDFKDGTTVHFNQSPQIKDLGMDLIQIKADILPASQGRPSCEMATSGVPATAMQDLECPVCHEVLRTPKMLPCGHSLCASPCLQQLAGDQDHVKCPECRADHQVPVGGTSEFPTNFFLLRVVESTKSRVCIDQSRCPGCSADSVILRRCSHCGNRICEVCRQGHTDVMKQDLKRQFAVSPGQIESSEFAQKEGTTMKQLEHKVTAMHDEVNRVTESFHQVIKKRKMELRQRIDDFKISEVDKIQAQTQKTRASFAAFCEEKQRVLDGDVPQHVVMQLEDDLCDKMVKFQSEDNDKCEISDAKLCVDEQVIAQSLSKFGDIRDGCQVVVQAVPLDIDREFINVKCCIGRQGTEPGLFSSPTAVQVSPVTGNIVVADGGNKRIQIFSPKGEFIHSFTRPYEYHKSVKQLDINTEGDILLLCQDAILVSYNENGKCIDKFSVDGAISFALAPNGDVHVGMSAGGVDVISQAKKVTSYIIGREQGRADRICITKSGEIYVLQFTDRICQKIFGFNKEFQLISLYSGSGSRGSLRLISDKYFLATDHESHSVTIYDLQWKKIKQIGAKGSTVHGLCFPRDAAVTHYGDVVVVSDNHVMQFF